MAISLTAEAVIFAINSAIKLGSGLQRAYANSIKAKSILLPLPKFDVRPNVDRANRFFVEEEGQQFVGRVERIKVLCDTFSISGLTGTAQDEFVDYYLYLQSQLDKSRNEELVKDMKVNLEMVDDTEINLDNMLALLRVRQWEMDDLEGMPRNTPLKLVAGTLVEIGIDYFNQVPGALNPESSVGKVLTRFLSAMDDVKFSEIADLKDKSQIIIPRLFIAAAESLESLSKDISGDEKIQAFIEVTSRGIAEKVLQATRHPGDEEAVNWGQLVLRSLVKNAGTYVFSAPGDLFQVNEGAAKLIQSTGNVLLEAILSDPDKINLKNGFNIDMLDKVVRSALGVIAEHPELIDGREGFRDIIMGVSSAMAEAGIKNRPDLLPELVRLILEHTAGNIHLLLSDRPEEEGKHILVIAVQQFLLAISRPVPEGRWKPDLPKGELVIIAGNILDEVVTNPNWVLAKVGEKTLLRETLDATFEALSGLPKEQRLSKDIFQLILQVNIRTVVTSQAVLSRIKWGDEEKEVTILQKSLDLVFHFVFESGKVAPAERIQLLTELLRYISGVILAKHPDARGLILIDMVLFQDPNVNFAGGFNAKLADELIASALNVLETHPDLISNKVPLQNIISGVAGALEASSFRTPGLLPELVRLSLKYTAENIHLIVTADQENPKYLLVVALKELLSALSIRTEDDHWQPRLTGHQIVSVAENVFDKLVQHPEWLVAGDQEESVFGAILTAIFGALGKLPKDERLQTGNLDVILQLGITTAATHPQLLKKIHWGSDQQETVILEQAIGLAIAYVFERSTVPPGDRIRLLVDLLHYILEVIMERHPNKKGLLLIDLILFEDPDVDFSMGFRPALADQLFEATLKVLDYRPDLVTSDDALQKIIEGVAGALKGTGFRRKGLLPDLIRLILENTAENLQLIIKTDTGTPDYLLVVALRQLLAALTGDVEDGQWKPALSGHEVLLIAEDVFDEFIRHPEWVTPGPSGDSLFAEITGACLAGLRSLPKDQRLQPATLAQLLRLCLQTAAASPHLLKKIHWGTEAEEAAILEYVFRLTSAFVFERSGISGGQRLELFTNLLHYLLEMLMSRHPDKKGLLLLDLVLFEDPDVDFSQGFQPELFDGLIEAGIKVLDYRPDLITEDHVFQHVIVSVMGALKDSGFKKPGILPELVRLVLASTAENIQLIVKVDAGSPRFLLVVALEALLEHLSTRPGEGEKWAPHLNIPQMLNMVEEVLDYLVIHSGLVTGKLREGTIFSETLNALFAALSQLPKDQRLQPDHLAWIMRTSLQAAATSRELLGLVHWGDEEEEAVILEKALDLVFAYIFPKEGPGRGEALEEVLEYTLEFILRHHQDKKALLLLYLILFEAPGGGLRLPLRDRPVEELTAAALRVLTAYPELVTNDLIWQKIIADTGGALEGSGMEIPELLPEMLRLMLLHTADNIDLLTGLKPDSPRYLLAVAMEQCLQVLARKPKPGKWKPQLSLSHILEIMEKCLETVVNNPFWIKDKMLQLVLESIFESMQSVPEERKWPYTSIRLLIEKGLKAVSFRKNLVIEIVHHQGRRQVIALTYALEGLLVSLYNEDEANAVASWTLTQIHVLDAILDSFLEGLVEGPITKEAIDEALQPVADAITDLAENAAFSLDELLQELAQ